MGRHDGQVHRSLLMSPAAETAPRLCHLTPGFGRGLRSGERDFALDSVVQPDALDLDARACL